MITWRKLMRSGQMILPNIIFLGVVRCGCYPPTLVDGPFTPQTFQPGTVVAATISGADFAGCGYPVIYIDGKINGGGVGVWCDFDGTRDSYTDTSIPVTLHIDLLGTGGQHYLAVGNDHGACSPKFFDVDCGEGGTPAPLLLGVTAQNGAKLVPGGTVTFRFEGFPFVNPQVLIDGSDVHVAPGPYNVQYGRAQYFDADITADPNAAGSIHSVYVIDDGCPSNVDYITVDASQPPPSPTPGAPPFLRKIFSGDVQNPAHITKYASTTQGGTVSLYFEGTGFGTNSEIVVDSNNFVQQIVEIPGATNPETARTGRINFYLPAGTDSMVTLHVHNLDNDMRSNRVLLILDEPDPPAPVVDTAYFLINGFAVTEIPQNGDADLYIYGRNFEGVTEQSFSGVGGLTFSNVSYPVEGAVRVHVHADATAPLSADKVTNLTVTNFDGTRTRKSNLFWIGIVPAPPP